MSGIDIADDAVKYASEELSLEAYAGDYLAFQDKDVYDIICMWDTIEHLSAPDKYIEKAHKCLTPWAHPNIVLFFSVFSENFSG